MTLMSTPVASIETLLKLARVNAASLRQDLSELEDAKNATSQALKSLEQDVEAERAQAAPDPINAPYFDAKSGRRTNLLSTLHSLERSEESLRKRVEVAALEILKLEHLIEAERKKARKAETRRDDLAQDDFSTARFGR